MKKSLLALILIASPAYATNITIPGTSDLWLAGMPNGTRASGFTPGSLGVDVAPLESPVTLNLNVGQNYEFFATGLVSNGPCCPFSGPDGAELVHHYAGAENGVNDLVAPLNSLIGLFAGQSNPFFIGSHFVFTAPVDTLYLGTMDGWEWNNNLDAFFISWADEPPPPQCENCAAVPESSTLLLVASGLIVLFRRR